MGEKHPENADDGPGPKVPDLKPPELEVPEFPVLPAGREAPQIPKELTEPVRKPASMARKAKEQSDLGHIASLSTSFLVSVVAGGALGWMLQRWVWPGAAPWPLVVGIGVGLLAGFIRFVREGLKIANRS